MYKCFWDSLTPESAALAAWIAAIATIVLIRGLWLTKQAMDISARSAVFQLMYKRFNSPDMLHARALFAKTYLDNKENKAFWKNNTLPAWKLLHFLNQVGHLVEERRIDFMDVVLAYCDHVTRIGNEWKVVLGNDCHEDRYAPFLRLHERMKNADCPGMFKTDLDNYYDDEFWKCESSVDANANKEG